MTASLPPAVRSRAYDELRKFVDTEYNGRDEEFRAMLFCIAYTEYSKSKKARLGRLEEAKPTGGSLTTDDVQNVLTELCHQDEYRDICKKSEETLLEFGDRFSEDILAGIAGGVTEALKPQLVQLRHGGGFLHFVAGSIRHALEIVLAAFILWGLYELLVVSMPVLEELVTKYLGKIIELINGE